jgi:hypothetical protein
LSSTDERECWSWSAGADRHDDRLRSPDFFNRIVDPVDLYGFLTSRNSVKDLCVSGQKTR